MLCVVFIFKYFFFLGWDYFELFGCDDVDGFLIRL